MIGTYGSKEWNSRFNFFQLGEYKVSCAVPRGHKLAKKKLLHTEDLRGEKLMKVQRGDSPGLDAIRDMLESEYPQVQINDTSYFYDVETFNTCENTDSVLLTLDAWADIHPSLITIPVDWDYAAPYGLLYSKKPTEDVLKFLDVIKRRTHFTDTLQ